MNNAVRFTGSLLIAAMAVAGAQAQERGTFTVRHLVPETALKATRAALEDCRKRGYQVAVAVVDRSGVVQALVRDRFAGPHTPNTAIGKGWTAISFRSNTLPFAEETKFDRAAAGIRHLPGVVAIGGGVLIEVGGSIVGAIGVSGAPGGDADEQCARAGLAAIRDDIDF